MNVVSRSINTDEIKIYLERLNKKYKAKYRYKAYALIKVHRSSPYQDSFIEYKTKVVYCKTEHGARITTLSNILTLSKVVHFRINLKYPLNSVSFINDEENNNIEIFNFFKRNTPKSST